MRHVKLLWTGLLLTMLSNASFADCAEWLNHTVPKLHSSQTIDLCNLTQGKPVLIVNTASHCGFTHQFKGLEALHQRYSEQGLVVIGFPSRSFNQEAKDEAKTAAVCYKNYGVSFAMTGIVPVKGEGAHDIFKHLAKAAGEPRWNFTKYLVDASGKQVQQFSTQTSPDDTVLISAVESLL